MRRRAPVQGSHWVFGLWAPPRLRAGFALGDLPASCVCPGSSVLLMRHTLRVTRGYVLLARIGLRVLGSPLSA